MHSVKKVETLWPLNSNTVVKMALKNDKTKIFPIGVLEGQWYTGKKIRQLWAEYELYVLTGHLSTISIWKYFDFIIF